MDTWSWSLVCTGLLVFWSIGAYNRLTRLRSAVRIQYGAFADTARLCLQLYAVAGTSEQLQAGKELRLALDVAAHKPLDAAAVSAVSMAMLILEPAWQLSAQTPRPDVALPAESSPVQAWPAALLALHTQRTAFNLAVTQYNRGRSQFPAKLLAWVLGMAQATALQEPKP